MFAETWLILALSGAAVLGVGMWRWQRPSTITLRYAAIGAYGLLMIAGVLLFDNTQDATPNDLDVILNRERPTVMMLYTHFCVECVALLPQVRNLSNVTEEPLTVITLDIDNTLGQSAVATYGFEPPMLFILFDADGQEINRTSTIPTAAQLTQLFD